LQTGTCKELYNRPVDLYCANFLGKVTKIDENIYIRPENIKISDDGDIEGVIKEIIFYGNFYEVVFANNQEFLIHSFDDTIEVNQKVKLKLENRVIRF
jgi:iron(III) transport system ATP-binding protein